MRTLFSIAALFVVQAAATYDIKECTEGFNKSACDDICTNADGIYGYWDGLAACISLRNIDFDAPSEALVLRKRG